MDGDLDANASDLSQAGGFPMTASPSPYMDEVLWIHRSTSDGDGCRHARYVSFLVTAG
jgi:hypothetical protein